MLKIQFIIGLLLPFLTYAASANGNAINEANISLQTSSNSSLVAISLSRQSRPGTNSDNLLYQEIKVSSPVDNNEHLDTIANLEGLPSGAALAYSGKFRIGSGRKRDSELLAYTQESICREIAPQYDYKNPGKPINCKELHKYTDDELVPFFNMDQQRRWRDAGFTSDAKLLISGWSLQYGRKEFGYVNDDFIKNAAVKNPWLIGGSIGFWFFRAPTNSLLRSQKYTDGLLTFGVKLGEDYEDVESQIFCPSSQDQDRVACTTYKVGEPIKKEKQLVYISYHCCPVNFIVDCRNATASKG